MSKFKMFDWKRDFPIIKKAFGVGLSPREKFITLESIRDFVIRDQSQAGMLPGLRHALARRTRAVAIKVLERDIANTGGELGDKVPVRDD